jgi:WD repeat-containing protein 1 (actin-interacting protein 1)
VSTNSDTMEVAVGGDDSKVHIYALSGTSLDLKYELEHLGAVTNCAYSPDKKYLVACDVNRKVILYGLPEYKVIFWVFTSATLTT